MLKKVTGIITDFDNTLVQTQKFVKDHLYHTCTRLKISAPKNSVIYAVLKKNLPFEEIFSKLFGKDLGEKVLAAYREDAMNTPYTATSGAHELISTAKQKEIPVIIVSNRTNMLAERLQQAGFNPKDFVNFIAPAIKKPNIGAYTEALAELATHKAQPKTTLIIGDSLDDFLALPENLKDNFLAVVTGPNTKEEFYKLGVSADNVLKSLVDFNNTLF